MLKIYFLVIHRRKCLEVVLLKKKKNKKIQLYNLLDKAIKLNKALEILCK